MRVLMICFVYNEIKYLPHTIDYYQKNGCEIYIIDNYSSDGTWEWLQENNIPSHRIDTNESFDLRILQQEIVNTLPKLKPDWVVYAGADLYFIAGTRLKDYIERVDSMGYNQLSMMCWSAFNTSEKHGVPLPLYYYYALPWRHVTMISRYNTSYIMNGDNVMIDEASCYPGKHCMAINYGACKPREEQEIKLKRRRIAWENGMSVKQGKHFLTGEKLKWIYDRKNLTDLRKVPEYKYILRALDSDILFRSETYNKMYSESITYKKHYRDMVYFDVWKHIADKLKRTDRILDLGCGPGQLAQLLYDSGIRNYTGIDFSNVAIMMAKERVPEFIFIDGDLRDIDYTGYMDHVLISTETFEHIENDIDLIRKLPRCRIIFSVPDFMCTSHYRTYGSEAFIREYYKNVLNIINIKRFDIGNKRVIFVVEAVIK